MEGQLKFFQTKVRVLFFFFLEKKGGRGREANRVLAGNTHPR
jgi:hypothetical protein